MMVKFKGGALFLLFLLFSVSPACALSQGGMVGNVSSSGVVDSGLDVVSVDDIGVLDSESYSQSVSVGGDGGFQGELDGYNQTLQSLSSSTPGIDTLENMDYNSTWGNIQGNSGIDTINDNTPTNTLTDNSITSDSILNYRIILSGGVELVELAMFGRYLRQINFLDDRISLLNRILTPITIKENTPYSVILRDVETAEYSKELINLVSVRKHYSDIAVSSKYCQWKCLEAGIIVVEVGIEVYRVVDDMVRFCRDRPVETTPSLSYDGVQVC